LKFKVDKNLPVECAESLRAAGYAVETLSAEAFSGSQDAVLCDHSKREERIFITLDFGSLRVNSTTHHPGVVVLRPPDQDKPTLLSLLGRFVEMLPSRSPGGQLGIVAADRIRFPEQ
jgi:predicted nuclease of predicted toxin-antitoxin system